MTRDYIQIQEGHLSFDECLNIINQNEKDIFAINYEYKELWFKDLSTEDRLLKALNGLFNKWQEPFLSTEIENARTWFKNCPPKYLFLKALTKGYLSAYGYYSEEKKMPLRADWKNQTYKQFSKKLYSIPCQFWGTAIVRENSLRFTSCEFKCIQIKEYDFRKFFGLEKEYVPPYMHLMNVAIRELGLSETIQLSAKRIENWFRLQSINGVPITETEAKKLASFIRMPEPKRGGAKKIKNKS